MKSFGQIIPLGKKRLRFGRLRWTDAVQRLFLDIRSRPTHRKIVATVDAKVQLALPEFSGREIELHSSVAVSPEG